MLTFRIKNNLLILVFETTHKPNWVYEKLESGRDEKFFSRIFTFTKKDLYDNADFKKYLNSKSDVLINRYENTDLLEYEDEIESYKVEFILGKLEDDYFKIEKPKLSLNNTLFIHKSIELDMDYFILSKKISFFKKIDKLVKEDIYVGGDRENAIPDNIIKIILKKIPNDYQVKLYVESLITPILEEYLNTTIDSEQKYQKYMNKKSTKKGENLTKRFQKYELEKYEIILKKLKIMLDDNVPYNENQWQDEIIQILLLLYPKYIKIFKEVYIQDYIKKTKRKLDYMLIDSNGNIDIVEIKKPNINPNINGLITDNPGYRQNYTPIRVLSGTIMQVEKYIFHLTRWGNKGETVLTNNYKFKLPSNFKIKITNPSGIVIMGRDNTFNEIQKQDFEVIKRKYKNIIDIITYDDLLRRLEFIINSLKE